MVKQDPEKVIRQVAKDFGLKPEELLVARTRRREAKEVAIYLLKRESGLSLKEIGERMGVSYGAVGHYWTSAKERMKRERAFAQILNKYNLEA